MSANFDLRSYNYPVIEILAQVRAQLEKDNTLIISAAPGAGKSTLVPLALMNEAWLSGKKIIMLEPRRLAAGTVARRMAEMLGEEVGERVGYRIRFESKVTPRTKIEVVTEGILTRMLHDDNELEGVGLVIFDEFHERSLNADLALALCRDTQNILRPDLRILIMSATLDMPLLSEKLGARVLESKGRMFPVKLVYTNEQDELRLPELCCRTILRALRETTGDVLVFLPGEAEITRCADLLAGINCDISLHPLYGRLSFAEQKAAINYTAGERRKVVLTTSIAETSLTIEGITVVVDSGFRRSPRFDAQTGLSSLQTQRITLDSAEQRAGRAGRLSEGVCYRMWSIATEERMQQFRTPEIADADLSGLCLDLAVWGAGDVSDLIWLSEPPATAIASARGVLTQLGAIANGRITSHGKALHRLPAHPRIAHMLKYAAGRNLQALASDVAALLEERDVLPGSQDVGFGVRIQLLRKMRERGELSRRLANIEKLAGAYRRIFRAAAENGPVDEHQIGLLLSEAFPERIAAARKGYDGQFLLANGQPAFMDSNDMLAGEAFIAVAQLDARKGMARIFLAAPLNPADVMERARRMEVVNWDSRKGGLQARAEFRIGSIVLATEVLTSVPTDSRCKAIAQVIRDEGERLLNFSEQVQQLQNRMLSLAVWRPDENWPDLSTTALLEDNERWFGAWFEGLKKNEDLYRLNLKEAILQGLGYERQSELDRLAPAQIWVPSGSMVTLKYFPDGSAPVLAVRLQEVFQLVDTPMIDGGRRGVVMHLLSPGFKPVQVTSDLRSFWTNTYFEVKKELKRRYPKHAWPEDPLAAEAVRGVRRK